MAKAKTPKQIAVKIKSLKKQVGKLEKAEKKAKVVEAKKAKKKPAKRKPAKRKKAKKKRRKK